MDGSDGDRLGLLKDAIPSNARIDRLARRLFRRMSDLHSQNLGQVRVDPQFGASFWLKIVQHSKFGMMCWIFYVLFMYQRTDIQPIDDNILDKDDTLPNINP